jgi:uncharacterized protein
MDSAISPQLLALLRCPETRQPLALASADLVNRIEARRARGELRDIAGNPVQETIAAGLVRGDAAVFFPIVDGIPMLIPGAGIATEGMDGLRNETGPL